MSIFNNAFFKANAKIGFFI